MIDLYHSSLGVAEGMERLFFGSDAASILSQDPAFATLGAADRVVVADGTGGASDRPDGKVLSFTDENTADATAAFQGAKLSSNLSDVRSLGRDTYRNHQQFRPKFRAKFLALPARFGLENTWNYTVLSSSTQQLL